MLYISISANHKQVDQIVAKAKALNASISDELYGARGWSFETEQDRLIKVFSHSEELMAFINSLEPTIEPPSLKRELDNAAGLVEASPEEVVKYAYDSGASTKKSK